MAKKRAKGTAAGGKAAPQAAMMTLTELEQVRVLSDPLRLRIVEQFCEKEQTTKQVAEALGEKPTKLYHHVDALEKVGLIRQTRTRRNRGTLERYYLAVARAFKADARLFGGAEPQPTTETLQSMYATIFETTAREVTQLTALADLSGEGATEEGVLSFLHVEADKPTIRRLVRRLNKLLADLQALADTPDDTPRRAYRLTLAFYPLDPLAARPAPDDDEASS